MNQVTRAVGKKFTRKKKAERERERESATISTRRSIIDILRIFIRAEGGRRREVQFRQFVRQTTDRNGGGPGLLTAVQFKRAKPKRAY